MKKYFLYGCVLFFISFFCFSYNGCFLQQKDAQIDVSLAKEISSLEEWAVIIDSYATLKSKPDSQSDVAYHCRQGDVFQILGNKIVFLNETKTLWYQLQDGWINGEHIRIFSNKLQAEFYSKGMKQ